MRVFKLKSFAKFCRKSGIDDQQLLLAINEIDSGLVDANLGGEVFKHRVARRGQGKSGGFRTIIALRVGHRAIFVKGFAKKEMANISQEELQGLKIVAQLALNLGDNDVNLLVTDGDWIEVNDDAKAI
jgi:hypothetical protein